MDPHTEPQTVGRTLLAPTSIISNHRTDLVRYVDPGLATLGHKQFPQTVGIRLELRSYPRLRTLDIRDANEIPKSHTCNCQVHHLRSTLAVIEGLSVDFVQFNP